jgi:hypothetical protein
MKSAPEQFSELRTAAIASGKITAKQIIEATKGIESMEGRLNVLEEMTKPLNITVPVPESVSDKIANLTEKILTSGKVSAVQINESMKDCLNEAERFDALRSLAVAKKIDTPRVERKNGTAFKESASSVRPTKEDRIASYARKMKCSFREAALFLGEKNIGSNTKETTAVREARAERWRAYYGPLISEADLQILVERGLEP